METCQLAQGKGCPVAQHSPRLHCSIVSVQHVLCTDLLFGFAVAARGVPPACHTPHGTAPALHSAARLLLPRLRLFPGRRSPRRTPTPASRQSLGRASLQNCLARRAGAAQRSRRCLTPAPASWTATAAGSAISPASPCVPTSVQVGGCGLALCRMKDDLESPPARPMPPAKAEACASCGLLATWRRLSPLTWRRCPATLPPRDAPPLLGSPACRAWRVPERLLQVPRGPLGARLRVPLPRHRVDARWGSAPPACRVMRMPGGCRSLLAGVIGHPPWTGECSGRSSPVPRPGSCSGSPLCAGVLPSPTRHPSVQGW